MNRMSRFQTTSPEDDDSSPDRLSLDATSGDWPFQARDDELAFIESVIEQAEGARDRPAGVVLVAPAGVGKTRLLREALRRAADAGAPTILAIATRSAADLPYGALTSLLANATDPQQAGSVTDWHREVAAALGGSDRRTVLAIDDAHLLDPPGAALVLHLALTGAVTVLATIRRGEEAPDAITAIWRDQLGHRIDLQPFSATETEGFVRAVLGGEVDGRTGRELTRVSGGNVLYAAELVRGSVAAGSLRRHDGVWRWDGQVVLAPRLVDAVQRRFGSITPELQRSLAAVALAEPVSLPLAAQVAGEEALAALAASGLITTTGEDEETRCRVAHPLFGDVALEMVGAITRRRLRRSLADALEALPHRDDHETLRLATWRLDLGEGADPTLLEDAALVANRSFDYRLAARLARAADAPGRPGTAAQLARALSGMNRFDEARGVLAEAEPHLAEAPFPAREQYLMAGYTAWYMGGGRRDEMLGVLERFEHTERSTADDADSHRLRVLATAFRANVLLDDGRLDEVVAITDTVLSQPDRAAPISVVLSLEAAAEALTYLGDVPHARELHARLRDIAATGPPETRRGQITSSLQEVLCLTCDDELDRAAALAAHIRAQTADIPDPEMNALIGLVTGATQLQQGRPAAAEVTLRDAIRAYTTMDIGNATSWALSMLAQALAVQGRPQEARSALADARGRADRRDRVARTVPDLVLAETWVLAAGGSRTDAMRRALRGADEVGAMAVHRARLLHLAARLGADPAELVAPLTQVVARTACRQPRAYLDHVTALAEANGPRLLELADAFAARGSLLVAAEAAGDAARALRRAHRQTAAARADALGRALAARCDGAAVPHLAVSDSLPGLSPREAQIARLASQGLSNVQIADELVLSVRTVESHLYQAYGKLGVSRRDQLPTVLGPDGDRSQ